MLPVIALLRRADLAVVIGTALLAKAAGAGFRSIAAELGRPAETVRGWLRAFAGAAESVRSWFTVVLTGLDPDPQVPAATGTAFADAVTVILAVADATSRRWPPVGTVSPWQVACAVQDLASFAADAPELRRALAHFGSRA